MNQRIEYLDAMRGFTMILVVLSHVVFFGLGNNSIAFNEFFCSFRMPLFFFISGFLFYKMEREWNYLTIRSFVTKKFLVQIIPTCVFLFLFIYIFDLFELKSLGSYKLGYWFTITLFEYFLLYISSALLTHFFHKASLFLIAFIAITISFCSFWYDNNHQGTGLLNNSSLLELSLSAIGFINFKYYCFFVFATFIKRYFNPFITFIDNHYYIGTIVIFFFLFPIFTNSNLYSYNFFVFFIRGILGIIVIFSFFKINENHFNHNTILGKFLQYIGKRTLDIYLLHYFFLPRNMVYLEDFLTNCNSTVIELFVSITISLMVISITLLISNTLRLSPFLAYYLFGVKSKK